MAFESEERNVNGHNMLKKQWGRLISCLPQLSSIDLVHSTLTLGRSDECDVVIYKSKFLPNQLLFISKKHFIIERDPEDAAITYIIDLSKNGTYLNNILIGRNKRVILQSNDCIAIGERLKVYIFKSMNYVVDENYLPEAYKNKYELSHFLGKGACGEVRLAYDKYTCQKYALKKITKGRDTASQLHNINHPNRIYMEISILWNLSHPLVVGMESMVETEEDIFIVLEYVRGGELSKRLSSHSNLSEANSKFLFYQIVLAIQYLHKSGVTHRDVKPGNVLLASDDPYTLIKLTDFGLSSVTEGYDLMKTMCGTWHYIAPEIIDQNIIEYDKQVDVWSMGVVLYYMLSKTLPFYSDDKSTLGKMIISGTYSMIGPAWYEISESAKDLIKQMLIVDPRKRITVDGILSHPWIKQDSLMQFRVDSMLRKALCQLKNLDIDDENTVSRAKKIKLRHEQPG
ncbi:unnamed protein product [Acanthoscelides obtectus]|uniref:Uncharacterized protein n=1 Tax=Acanthoscelides obtectus TaxID=200917 RepID=A0A9P0M1Z7_ACAOB|nr:unnamed protein product [Acanthoscelides obtectus]CAK1626404.1 Ovarian-specific serine/threonine-protein kinase Lok [Acanthoscelides obtectus]